MYLFLNCKYSYRTVQSYQSKLLLMVYLFFIDIGKETKKYREIQIQQAVFSLACYLFKHLG